MARTKSSRELKQIYYTKDIDEIIKEINIKYPIKLISKDIKKIIKKTEKDNPALDQNKIAIILQVFFEAIRDLSLRENKIRINDNFHFKILPRLFINANNVITYLAKPLVKLFQPKI